jgi:hypothetical protein
MKEEEKKILLFIYYCSKLREGKYLEGGPIITAKGFDIALDIIETGFKLDEESVKLFCKGFEVDHRLSVLVMAMQEIGLSGMNKISENI